MLGNWDAGILRSRSHNPYNLFFPDNRIKLNDAWKQEGDKKFRQLGLPRRLALRSFIVEGNIQSDGGGPAAWALRPVFT